MTTTNTEKLAADFDAWALDAELHSADMVPVHRNTLRNAAALLRSQQLGQDEREAFEAAILPHCVTAPIRVGDSYYQSKHSLAWIAWQAARLSAPQAAGVPDGWVLVPAEPTDEMLSSAKSEVHKNNGARDKSARIFRAMLNAAPEHNPKGGKA